MASSLNMVGSPRQNDSPAHVFDGVGQPVVATKRGGFGFLPVM
jgi:hypothetical protein